MYPGVSSEISAFLLICGMEYPTLCGWFSIRNWKIPYSPEMFSHLRFYCEIINLDNIIETSAWGDPKVMMIWIKKYKSKYIELETS